MKAIYYVRAESSLTKHFPPRLIDPYRDKPPLKNSLIILENSPPKNCFALCIKLGLMEDPGNITKNLMHCQKTAH